MVRPPSGVRLPGAEFPSTRVLAGGPPQACGGWVEAPHSQGRLVGLITDGDLRRALRDHSSDTWSTLKATDLMTADPITISSELMAVEAIQRMEHNRRKPISVMPVVNANGEFQGLLRLHDLVQAGLA